MNPFRSVALALLMAAVSGFASVERVTVDHAYVTGLAQKLAAKPYAPAEREAPKFFREINYDTYRNITFRPEKSLWRDTDLRFQVQFFHPGYIYPRMLRVNEFSSTHTQPIPFSQDFFDYHGLDVPLLSRRGLNFAGFRILHPINRPEAWDEVISFLGASYFRGLGRHQAYGASARGLAVNAGGPAPEEFPEFTEYWISKPEPADVNITVHALLDGPSVAGAYTFVITPGDELIVDTTATLFFRHEVETPGFAPVSTMFWFGEATHASFGDFRPEVHDSDGLLVAPDANTRLWRPLRNPTAVSRTDFEAPQLAGFGLLQRDRDQRSYEDIEANYERRPSVWMEPAGKWPPGRVRLVELPTQNEYQDNITAFWTPAGKVAPGQPYELAWKQRWTGAAVFGGPPGWVRATHQTLHDKGAPGQTKYVIDFEAGSLANVPEDAILTADVTVTPGAEVKHTQVFRNMSNGARRLIVVLSAAPKSSPVEVRARLMFEQKPITETWTIQWQP
ncbi:MAG TPA: glucan biosynthesis protein G [Lacunisphaera sp.]|nr:glucan biosynthesis protein G [Lacunisphaera sp.]